MSSFSSPPFFLFPFFGFDVFTGTECGQQTTCDSCQQASQCQWCVNNGVEACLSQVQACTTVVSICERTVLPQFLAGLFTPLVALLLAVIVRAAYRKFKDDGQMFREDPGEN